MMKHVVTRPPKAKNDEEEAQKRTQDETTYILKDTSKKMDYQVRNQIKSTN